MRPAFLFNNFSPGPGRIIIRKYFPRCPFHISSILYRNDDFEIATLVSAYASKIGKTLVIIHTLKLLKYGPAKEVYFWIFVFHGILETRPVSIL